MFSSNAKCVLTFVCCSILLAATNVPGQKKQTAPKLNRRPNIIFILADDLGYGEVGVYGQQKIKTPNLDRMAMEGMRLTQFYTGSPVCAPSRAIFLTGKHAGHAEVRDNKEYGGFADDEERGQAQLPNEPNIATWLKSLGYATALVGKWGLGGPQTDSVPNNRGFDLFYGYLDQKQAHNYYPTHLWRNRTSEKLNNPYFSPHQKLRGNPNDQHAYDQYKGNDYSIDMMTREAVKFIGQNHEHPFFLYYAPTLPHLALQVPASAVEQYKGKFPDTPYTNANGNGYLPNMTPRATYAAMISYLDAQVGILLEELKKQGLDKDTLVIFTSDNGTTYLKREVDYEFFNSVGNLRGLKEDVYEGGIREPFIARMPGTIPAGRTSDVIAATYDMWATFADLLGAKRPAGTDGISILPALAGMGKQTAREYLYWEFAAMGGQQAVRMGNWKGVRRNLNQGRIKTELYNLADDIGEKKDVAAENPKIVAKIERIMREAHTPSKEFPIKVLDDVKVVSSVR